jgi:hypothetical protein
MFSLLPPPGERRDHDKAPGTRFQAPGPVDFSRALR